ncbi:hypothetical protein DV451_004221 [Geotrichum candidum]|uniref:60S ribosomal subunit assembly/export protein LOC1 n=1 Tax=Geotrichum candidum TaxID=1173061 RepID=A0A9P5G188_GEOCN|nr:hypothetical protein DV451_004221 [Geotrichum candidum]KAI9213846.1 hypothetical protein DS838_001275 [Geotrichum bryndzae]KAF5105537.1 hypothetical protein DV453_004744 [Geotrichum candidum]KAF5112308.1 hypothetical protein DV452_004098 [Geotrichum candidum]KAF7499143.1 hypothetical protein DV113_002833 [Geotrichum candidum]
MVARKRNINPQRENVSDIKTDNVAKNRLASSSANYKNTGKKSTAKVTKGVKLNPLLQKKLNIPKLNRAIDPEGIKRTRGKKGKVFADSDAMMRILYTVTENVDSRNASKLEKARQLEAIREAKRVEMEKKEQERSEKLENKKREIKKAKRSKGRKSAPEAESVSDAGDSKKKKKVSFA